MVFQISENSEKCPSQYPKDPFCPKPKVILFTMIRMAENPHAGQVGIRENVIFLLEKQPKQSFHMKIVAS